MKAVLLNGCDTGQKAAERAGVIPAIGEYAYQKFKDEVQGKTSDEEQQRMMAMDILLERHERKTFPRLSPDVLEETEDTFILYL